VWNIIWIILIGFIAGLIACWLSPGAHNPTGFILTAALGIGGSFLATFIGQTIGWYRLDQGAGLIAATVEPSSCCSSGIGSLRIGLSAHRSDSRPNYRKCETERDTH
jgi:uncharacterized membrane protein YeaQ/YmgE (transglycosylase-associated protein family)